MQRVERNHAPTKGNRGIDGTRGNPLAAEPTERTRRHLHRRERVHRACRAVEPRVGAGKRRRQHDEREQRPQMRKSMLGKRCRKDALGERRVIPRQDRDEQRNRDDVERDDAPRHIAHRRRNTARGIRRLPRCQPDDLRPLKIDEDDDHRQRNTRVSVRGKAAAAE